MLGESIDLAQPKQEEENCTTHRMLSRERKLGVEEERRRREERAEKTREHIEEDEGATEGCGGVEGYKYPTSARKGGGNPGPSRTTASASREPHFGARARPLAFATSQAKKKRKPLAFPSSQAWKGGMHTRMRPLYVVHTKLPRPEYDGLAKLNATSQTQPKVISSIACI